MESVSVDMPALYYVCGYVAHHISKITACHLCSQFFTDTENEDTDEDYVNFFNNINRGKLLRPSSMNLKFMKIFYKIYVVKCDELCTITSKQQDYLMKLFLEIVKEEIEPINCPSGHSLREMLRRDVRSFSNCLLKNKANSFTFLKKINGKIGKLNSSN